ncbi:uncharacterized protein LOC111636281 isoform X2 [Centruroides sculpturatus]|uniref:uncharacterized protein LOC111636281 isoform X2 n=1 Tax=Centruroides sculpturatus TaxID=218467 RepID=UPI000C6CECC3|nr:uncharacterized protein LOC111636281 isoform X2 [Centruroides sculpturatus]
MMNFNVFMVSALAMLLFYVPQFNRLIDIGEFPLIVAAILYFYIVIMFVASFSVSTQIYMLMDTFFYAPDLDDLSDPLTVIWLLVQIIYFELTFFVFEKLFLTARYVNLVLNLVTRLIT